MSYNRSIYSHGSLPCLEISLGCSLVRFLNLFFVVLVSVSTDQTKITRFSDLNADQLEDLAFLTAC